VVLCLLASRGASNAPIVNNQWGGGKKKIIPLHNFVGLGGRKKRGETRTSRTSRKKRMGRRVFLYERAAKKKHLPLSVITRSDREEKEKRQTKFLARLTRRTTISPSSRTIKGKKKKGKKENLYSSL